MRRGNAKPRRAERGGENRFYSVIQQTARCPQTLFPSCRAALLLLPLLYPLAPVTAPHERWTPILSVLCRIANPSGALRMAESSMKIPARCFWFGRRLQSNSNGTIRRPRRERRPDRPIPFPAGWEGAPVRAASSHRTSASPAASGCPAPFLGGRGTARRQRARLKCHPFFCPC